MAAEHDDHVSSGNEQFDSFLAVCGGVADVFFFGTFDVRIAGPQGGDDSGRFVDAERGLGEVGQFVGGRKCQAVNVGRGFHERDALRCFTHGSDDFVVTIMPDEQNIVAVVGVADGFEMHFGDKWTGSVDSLEFSFAGDATDFGTDAVSAEEED